MRSQHLALLISLTAVTAGAAQEPTRISHQVSSPERRDAVQHRPQQGPGEVYGLTLDAAVAAALANNSEIVAAYERRGAASQRLEQAKGHRWFALDLSEAYSYTNNPAEVFALQLNQRRFDKDEFFASDPNRPDPLSTWITSIELVQPVYTGGKLAARIGQAESMASAKERTYFHTRQRVAFETISAFVNLAEARENVGLIEKARSTTAEHVKLAEQYAAQGVILEADVLQARVYLSEMDDLLAQAQSGASLAQASLNFQMGADQTLPRTLAPLLPAAPVTEDLDFWIATALSGRHDLGAARLQMEAGKLEEKVSRSGYLPEIAVLGRYDLYDDRIFGSYGHSGSVMAVAKINLFRGGSDAAALEAARHDTASFAADIRHFEEGIRLEVQQAWQDLATARTRHATATSALAAANEALRVRERRFKQGLDKMIDLLDAETALREAKLRQLVARFDVVLGTHRLLFVAGATPISHMEESS
ncbi:MAG: TolC family protein [Thermoanaerobaculales bacterium]